MTKLPKISVLIVNWNGLHHLKLCLPSLVSQDYPSERLEFVLVDNGSVDGSVDFVHRNYPKVCVLRNERNLGFAKPNNDAAREATGDYVALINNDMRADRCWLSKAIECLDEGRDRICIGSRVLDWNGRFVDFNGGTMQYLGYAVQKDIGRPVEECEAVEKEILFPCGGAMLIDRQVYLSVGGFDEDYFAIYEDVDLGWRLWLMGYRVAMAPHSLVFHRLHGTLDRSREEKMRYLMHRNALWTIIKNYSDEVLRKVLPAAVIQGVGRAMQFSGVDRTSFYLWAGQDAQIASAGGVPEAVLWQCRDAINHLVMLDDTFQALPQLRAKRALVQARRRVPDEEILPRFGDPFRNIMSDLRYELSDLDLVQSLGMDSLFKRQEEVQGWQQNLARRVSTEAGRLRGEIAALERQKKLMEVELMRAGDGAHSAPTAIPVAKDPKKSIPLLIREFHEMQCRQGLTAALRQTLQYLRRSR